MGMTNAFRLILFANMLLDCQIGCQKKESGNSVHIIEAYIFEL